MERTYGAAPHTYGAVPHRESSVPVDVARQRELKWLEMFSHWDKWLTRRYQKVGLPHSGVVGRYGALWGAVGRYGALWGAMGHYGSLWGAIGCSGAL